jgi:hypothetical protein
MSQNLTIYTIGQMPKITGPDLLYMRLLTKQAANRLYQSTYPFAKPQLPGVKLRRLVIFSWHRKLKSLFGKKFGSQRLRQISPVGKQQTSVAGGQFRQHFYIVDVCRCKVKAPNHSNRINLKMQAETIKRLIAKFLAIGIYPLEKSAKPCSGKSAYQHRKTVEHDDNVSEAFSNILEQPLLYSPEVGSLSDKVNPAGQIGEVMSVEVFEETEVFLSVSKPRISPTISIVSTSLSASCGAGPLVRSVLIGKKFFIKSSILQNTLTIKSLRFIF